MTTLRRRMAAASLLLAAPALTACGFNVQTDQVYQAAVGVDDREGTVDVLNALVVATEPGKGTFIATFVNNSTTDPATITGVSAGGQVEVPASLKDAEIGPEQLLSLSDEDDQIRITDSEIKAGYFYEVTLDLASGEQTTLNVPVVAPEGEYSEFADPNAPEPSPTENPVPAQENESDEGGH